MKKPLENFDYSNEPQFKSLSFDAARDLSNRYQKDCQPLLSAKIKGVKHAEDARSVVFTIEALKKLIWEIESNAQQVDPTRQLGIRLYYGKYPDIDKIQKDPSHPLYKDFAELPETYSFLHTVFAVPVYKDETGIFRDFNPWHSALSGVYVPIAKTDPIGPHDMTPQMNHGNLCPPPFNLKNDKDYGLCF